MVYDVVKKKKLEGTLGEGAAVEDLLFLTFHFNGKKKITNIEMLKKRKILYDSPNHSLSSGIQHYAKKA